MITSHVTRKFIYWETLWLKISLLVSCKKHLWKKILQSLKAVYQGKNEFILYIFSSPDNYPYSSMFIEGILCFCCSYVNELNFSQLLQSVPLEETEIGKSFPTLPLNALFCWCYNRQCLFIAWIFCITTAPLTLGN